MNLVKKYHDKLVKSLEYATNLAGKTTNEYKLDGSEGIFLTSLLPQALTNYTMSGTSRYGSPAEANNAQQYIPWDYDKSCAITVDKANYQDGGYLATAGAVIQEQNEAIVAPFVERDFYQKLAENAGGINATATALSASNVMGRIIAAEAAFRNAGIPAAERYLAIGTTAFQLIRQSLTSCDTVTDKLLLKGVVGRIGTLNIIEVADADLLSGVNFVAWQKKAALKAFDIKDAKVHQDPPGINGILVEMRVRGVAAVIRKYAGGVYVDCSNSVPVSAPSINSSTGAITVASGTYVMYTLDGSDPKTSMTAVKLTSSGTPTGVSGHTVKAVAYKTGYAPSSVASQAIS